MIARGGICGPAQSIATQRTSIDQRGRAPAIVSGSKYAVWKLNVLGAAVSSASPVAPSLRASGPAESH